MLLSMTGYGEARLQNDNLSLVVELRAVNNRYLKIVVRATEPYNLFELDIERVVRKSVRRGTIQVQLRVERPPRAADFRLNTTALKSYLEQISQLGNEMKLDRGIVSSLMAQTVVLPGVAPEPGLATLHADEDWSAIEQTLESAVARFQEMRRDEGKRMADELLSLRDQIGRELEQIRQRIPGVVVSYRDRLLDRVRTLLAEHVVELKVEDLIKEVAVFAERSDVAEEVVRLDSHLEQFRDVVLKESDGPGRKLEFLVQEMGRETNTIGSKASDVAISRHVVEIKAALEKIRELIQNVE